MTHDIPAKTLPSGAELRGQVKALSGELGGVLEARGWRVATAESCTGGGLAAAITEVSGSSSWFEYGLVTYANRAKQQLLGVSQASLETHGAVSEAVVNEMVQGALALSGADLAVAISGIAGPGGGSEDKPVGTVWLGWGSADKGKVALGARCYHFKGDRTAVRGQAVVAALKQLLFLAKPAV